MTPAQALLVPRRTPLVTSVRRVLAAIAVTLAVVGIADLAAPTAVTAWDTGRANPQSESALVALTNAARVEAGLRPLPVDATLIGVARWRSRDMAERDYFSHAIPGYGRVFDRLDRDRYCYTLAGENIGWADGGDVGVEARVHRMFVASPSHRANLLTRRWDVMAVGSFKRADGRKYWTVLFADTCAGVPIGAGRGR